MNTSTWKDVASEPDCASFRLNGWNAKTMAGEPCEAPRVEQRQVDRWPVQGAATAFCISSDVFGHMHDLGMLDYSHQGLAAISDTPIEPGTIVSIGFQAPGYLAKRGTVLRCKTCGDGYRVAIEFDLRMAA